MGSELTRINHTAQQEESFFKENLVFFLLAQQRKFLFLGKQSQQLHE